jgi:TonB family protein
MADRRDRTHVLSDGSALVLTGVVLVTFLITSRSLWHALPAAAVRDVGIELSLVQAPAETPPAPPPPVPPKARTAHVRTIPVAAAPAPLPLPVDPPEQPPADAAVMAAPPAAPAAAAVSRPDLEALYAAGLRADIDRRTRPPDSPQYRLHHPSGAVRVRFVVMRSGEPKAVAVEAPSGSRILDQAAFDIVSAGHYAPMPPKAFVGESQHTFVVTIEFRQASYASL